MSGTMAVVVAAVVVSVAAAAAEEEGDGGGGRPPSFSTRLLLLPPPPRSPMPRTKKPICVRKRVAAWEWGQSIVRSRGEERRRKKTGRDLQRPTATIKPGSESGPSEQHGGPRAAGACGLGLG